MRENPEQEEEKSVYEVVITPSQNQVLRLCALDEQPKGTLVSFDSLAPNKEIHMFVTTWDLKRRVDHTRDSFDRTAKENRSAQD